MLKSLFTWFDTHPSSYWLIVSGPTLLFLLWTAWPAFAFSQKTKPQPENRFTDGLVLFLLLIAWRWPWLLSAYQYSPDESQHIAGILTLAQDPVFFRSVDGSTAGPLNFYLPLPFALVLGRIDFFTVRLAALLLVWGALFSCYLASAKAFGTRLARLGLLSAALFFAATTDWEFLHYSTEHVPLFLFSLSLLALVKSRFSRHPVRWLFVAGFIAGLSPWAKLQIGPMSALLVAAGLLQIVRIFPRWPDRCRHGLALGLSTLIPTALFFAFLAPFGLTETGFQRYVVQNFTYVHDGQPTTESVRALANLAWGSRWFPVFAAGSLFIVTSSGIAMFALRRRPGFNYLFGAGLTLTATLCVVMPGRPFQHYLLLLIIPLMLWSLAASHELWLNLPHEPARRGLTIGLFALGVLPLLLLRLSQPVPAMFGLFAEHWRHPRSEMNELIKNFSVAGDRLALWGYAPEVYAATGLAQGTRDSYTYWSIAPSRQHDTYRSVYLQDIVLNRPAIFVDSVGPGSIYYPDREQNGHESFPALARYIDTHYVPVAERLNFRIYVRHELFAERSLNNAKFQASLRRSQTPPTSDISSEPLTVVNGRPEWLANRSVLLLAAPATLSEQLQGDERELTIAYGFHPRAIAAHASDGALMRIEIISDHYPPQPVFEHFMDPGAKIGDRVENSITIPLPPFPEHARLVLSVEPGPLKNRAWDWIYLSALKIRRSPEFEPGQFPAYSRVPESFSAAAAYYMQTRSPRLLMQHAPAQNVFRLKGSERRVQFAFGFDEGAYSGDSRTDGAIFRVLRYREGVAPSVLFERRLDPLINPSDRGEQYCSLDLVDATSGDLLVVGIDPAGNPSWDWTYVTDFNLQ